MAIHIEPLATSLPGLRAMRWSSDAPTFSMKEAFCIGRVVRGRSEWWTRGRTYTSAPGVFHVLHPGDVRRDLAMDGPVTVEVVAFSTCLHGTGERIGRRRTAPQLAAGDERAAAFVRLLDAVHAGADRLTLEVAAAEAMDALHVASPWPLREGPTRPVQRALDLLRARLSEPVTLDELAAHAELDKFHLCRAFRAQIGMPPHAYLTHLRIVRAKELLSRGARPRDVAPQVGLYDQSQLNRHFRRIVGTTPGRYGASFRQRHA